MAEEDISQKTVAILVVLTVIISVLGTLSVMSAINDMKTQRTIDRGSAQGEVSLTINEGTPSAEPVAATGRVALEINEPSSDSTADNQEQDNRVLLLPEET